MTTVPPAELIENYLRSRRVRYFRGHHDDEYFFLINTYFGRVQVHLQASGDCRDMVQIAIGGQCYFPAAQRAEVAALVDRWNAAGPPAQAMVYRSSDPGLVGVAAHNRYSAGRADDFGAVVDQTTQSAIELFGGLRAAVPRDSAPAEPLRDAG